MYVHIKDLYSYNFVFFTSPFLIFEIKYNLLECEEVNNHAGVGETK